ncbi:MAG: type II secretion system GspH family protein [Actinomycetota bacterium]|nr:type II secretion system GspH family protein [Actinomycetota bacterium]
MTRAHGQAGFALIELLTVMTISIVMLSAVLLTFEGFQSRADRNARLNESQSQTRQTIGQLARALRNLASPTPEQPQAIDSASAYDLVFQTVNPDGGTSSNITNVQRVRYCLDEPSAGDATLWAQTQTWTSATIPAMPALNGCPSTAAGWGAGTSLVTGVTNRQGNRPVFLYNATIKTDITAVTAQLWSRAATDVEPRLGVLRTQVFLRNQNQSPTAAFTATPAGTGHVLLNGSGSSDPEGDELRYDWYLDQAPDCRTGTPPPATGQGIVFDMAATSGTHTIALIVYDSTGLCSRTSRQVEVP